MFTPSPASLLAFRLLLATLGERPHLPDEARADALLRQIIDQSNMTATLAGVLVSASGDDLVLRRENRASNARTPGGPFGELLPSFDLPAARALAALLGRPAIPDPPWPK